MHSGSASGSATAKSCGFGCYTIHCTKFFNRISPILSNTPYKIKNYSLVFSVTSKLFLICFANGCHETQKLTLVSNSLKYLGGRGGGGDLNQKKLFVNKILLTLPGAMVLLTTCRWPPLLLPFSIYILLSFNWLSDIFVSPCYMLPLTCFLWPNLRRNLQSTGIYL
jgi:hypothetical protein